LSTGFHQNVWINSLGMLAPHLIHVIVNDTAAVENEYTTKGTNMHGETVFYCTVSNDGLRD
jgi:hypothetical protein